MIKYAIIGISHPHVASLYASLAKYSSEAVCIGWAHSTSELGADVRNNLGKYADQLTHFEDYHELIAQNPDLAIICCDNADTERISTEAIKAGISVALEKPMSIDYPSARRIADLAKTSGVTLAVNWPIAWFPSFNCAKKLCDEGRIGEIMRVVYRSPATWGPFSYSKDGQNPPISELAKSWWYQKERGGGSLLDYACYGAALSTWFFGHRALSAVGIAKNFMLTGLDVEDFSAMLLDFGSGVGLLEGSWSTFNCGEVPSGPVIYGSLGTIVCDRHSNLVKVYIGRSHKPIPPTEIIECPNLIDDFNFGRCILDNLTKGMPLHPLLEPEFNVSVMAALDAGRESAERGYIKVIDETDKMPHGGELL